MNNTILITNGRFPATLDLIRNLSKSGHKVIVAETSLIHYCATSKANARNVLIPSPRENEEEYILKILEVIEEEKVDLFIPAWEDALVVSKNLQRFKKGVAFTSSYDLVHSLHNKWEFSNLIQKLGFHTPKTMFIKSKEDLSKVPFENFYLKPSYTRGSEHAFYIKDKATLLAKKKLPKFPILAQEKLDGDQFCTYTVCHNGKITAHATYPLHYQKFDKTKTRGHYCLSFEDAKHDSIFAFVKKFAEMTGYTGSLAFDIFEKDGKLSILECNPRLTSGVTLLTDNLSLADAYLNPFNNEPIFPKEGACSQFFLPSLLFASKTAIRNGSVVPFVKTLFRTKDIVFRKKDMKPFFFQPIIGLYQIYLKFKYKESVISSYSHDLDYEEK